MKKPGADRNSASGQVMVLFRNRIPTNGNRAYLPPYFMRASAVRLRMKSVFFLGHSDKAILLEKVSDSFHQIADPGDQVQKGKTRDRTAALSCRPCGYR